MGVFSGSNPSAKAFLTGWVPTFFENPVLIYTFVLLVWISLRYFLQAIGVPENMANWTGMIAFIIVTAIIIETTIFKLI